MVNGHFADKIAMIYATSVTFSCRYTLVKDSQTNVLRFDPFPISSIYINI